MSARLRDSEIRFQAAVCGSVSAHGLLRRAQNGLLRVLDEKLNPHGSKSKALAIKAALDAVEEIEQSEESVAAHDSNEPDAAKEETKALRCGDAAGQQEVSDSLRQVGISLGLKLA